MAATRPRYRAVIAAPFGGLGIQVTASAVIAIDFLPTVRSPQAAACAFAREVVAQLKAYFRDPDFCFDLPLALPGTAFQARVWRSLRKIPVGSVLSYGELAGRLQSSARAVGNACAANPIPVIVPCHRVVASSGIGGFMGRTSGRPVDVKRWLLRHEHAA